MSKKDTTKEKDCFICSIMKWECPDDRCKIPDSEIKNENSDHNPQLKLDF